MQFLYDLLTRFAMCSCETRCAVTGVIIDAINAGCTIGADVVDTIVDV